HALEAAVPRDRAGVLETQIHEVATLDVLANNADRKRSHLLVTAGPRLRAIDNALTFLPYPRQRTALISLGGSRLPPKARAAVTALAAESVRLEALLARLRRLLSTPEVDAFAARVGELAADPTYPVLDS